MKKFEPTSPKAQGIRKFLLGEEEARTLKIAKNQEYVKSMPEKTTKNHEKQDQNPSSNSKQNSKSKGKIYIKPTVPPPLAPVVSKKFVKKSGIYKSKKIPPPCLLHQASKNSSVRQKMRILKFRTSSQNHPPPPRIMKNKIFLERGYPRQKIFP